jgi:hypothetical protein
MKNLFRSLAAAVALGLVFAGSIAPASATINPTVTLLTSSPLAWGVPGIGRIVFGTITFGASDTYVAGGFNVTLAQLGGQVAVFNWVSNSPTPAADYVSTTTNAGVTIKLGTQMQGTSNVTATQTTKSVTIPTGLSANDVLSANTPIFAALDDAATGGGGTGTWAVTDAVASTKETSTSAFTLTVIAAAPTNGGNFTYFIPTLAMEMAAGTPIASYTINFSAVVL